MREPAPDPLPIRVLAPSTHNSGDDNPASIKVVYHAAGRLIRDTQGGSLGVFFGSGHSFAPSLPFSRLSVMSSSVHREDAPQFRYNSGSLVDRPNATSAIRHPVMRINTRLCTDSQDGPRKAGPPSKRALEYSSPRRRPRKLNAGFGLDSSTAPSSREVPEYGDDGTCGSRTMHLRGFLVM